MMTLIACVGIVTLAGVALVPIVAVVVKTLAQAVMLGAMVGASVVLILLF